MERSTEANPRALVVDDEPDIRELLEITLGRMGIDAVSAADLEEGKRMLAAGGYDLCLTDMRLPDGNGIDFVRYMQQQHPDIPVAVITAHGNMESAIESLKAGAFDFVTKPVDLQVLRTLVNTALKLTRRTAPSAGDAEAGSGLQLIGESPAIQATRQTIAKVARSQAPIYISGESGTGKELVARLIHEQGARRDLPFVPVNCGAIPAELMESEFFGHKKGSFTGATADKQGLFQAAEGGTLFLDEVADLPLSMQVKLLRAIQEKAIRPIGSQREIPIDVRILSATHTDLGQLVEEGRFRQDLYYRINVIRLHVPSLRERRDDIPLLTEHFLGRIADAWDIPPVTISPAALKALAEYAYPGNVRELENILERAVTLCEGETIEPADLQLPEIAANGPAAAAPVAGGRAMGPPPSSGSGTTASLEPLLQDVEKEAIVKALEQTRYNKTAAARLLGISFRALRYRLKKLGLE
ncbi:MAG TPA: sigma-54 dependent transcriptional regulator [Gammaproteobacteria bacterium]|nr:sigma-54 dependent transcriptional regulator [Gammaproteobacteria bacterium]